jgi:hypothetical protein
MLSDAEALMESGNPAAAVGRLHEVVARYPESREALEAQFTLGVAYESMNSLKDAITAYSQYIARAPEGKHADEARERVGLLAPKYEADFPSADNIERTIESLRTQLQADPDSNDLAVQLANALWAHGDYEPAAKLYFALKDRDPSFGDSDTFTNHIEMHSDGTYTLLTPTELSKRERSQNPLAVFNLASFGAIRDSFTQVPRYFVVTGQAVNRSDSMLYGVEITITIYGFGGIVYDTHTVPMGNVRPGEIRAFSVRFSNFRELESIDRYDYTVSFRR